MYEIEKKEVDVVVWQTLRILKEGILSLGGRNIARVSIVLPFLSKFLVFYLDEEIGLETSLQPKPKRDKKSFFDDDEDDEDQGDQSVKNQFESYLKEIYIKPKECPGAWWRLNKDKSWHW